MAITGTLETLKQQCDLELFKKALEHLENANLDETFKSVQPGEPIKIEIDGQNAFAIYQTYESKPLEEAKMEGHKKYIDIQYIHSGTEQILVSPSTQITEDAEYNTDKDLYFPKTKEYSSFKLSAGMGCILYPDDIHAPCISTETPCKVEKIVFKVAVR